jgi:demethylmenaquinone methyltransferase/2-methoxy-6-polyprenyl-1,4-benzoquinol methylase
MARLPDRSLALEKYRRGIASYDESNRYRRLRANAVARLNLRPGDHVLDVACGTGLNFSLIQEAIGQHGRLIGVDLSPDMLAIARERASNNNWDQVTLINSAVEEAQLPDSVDAALFCLTHDVMRSPTAIQNVMRSVTQGGRVVAAGSKWAPWRAWYVNIGVWYGARRYTTTFDGFSCPWSHLSRYLSGTEIELHLRGAMYVASGNKE